MLLSDLGFIVMSLTLGIFVKAPEVLRDTWLV